VPTRFGPQPAVSIIRSEGRSICGVARAVGIPHGHVSKALAGVVRPRPELIDRLSCLLGRKPQELFTSEILSEPFNSRPTLRRGAR